MNKGKKELLENLRTIRETAEMDIKKNHPGYEDCIIKNVIQYNKPVELVKRKNRKKEKFGLCVALAEDPKTGEVWEMYYLDGEEVDFMELMKEHESATPIKDVMDETKENEEKPKEERIEELEKVELEELEEEKQPGVKGKKSKKGKADDKQETNQTDLTGEKPKYVIQTIDVDNAYVDNKTTVRKAFNLPADVKEIAIAKPMQEDENILSADLTMYMLDDKGHIIEEAEGKNIDDLFKVDKATGKKPINDQNTKFELGGYAERNKSHTMRRFVSKENPNLYLSAEQKEIGGYAQVYAGRKTMDGNDAVEVQLETRNVGIQSSLNMQRIVGGYKGIYNIEDINREVDEYEEAGNDTDRIEIENADGQENEGEYEGRVPWPTPGRIR